ncbi:glycosyltransferase family 2 protein [Mesorhizobium sp. SB112]|uniref:glycosyltransferase family 2 protein n=1 Tax=Mesorhizobium sp. SB112 TaxID=3151853 RepID=UPI003265D3E5
MRVISLTTIPPRFEAVGSTLKSLVDQVGQIDEIHLYVPKRYRRFPDYGGELPSVPAGVTIVRPEDDLGPASKVLFAARSLRGRDAQILFCDDDRLYRHDWAATLFDAQSERPNECVALFGKDLRVDFERPRQPRAIRDKSKLDYRLKRFKHGLASILTTKAIPAPGRIVVSSAGYADVLMGFGGAVVRPHFFDDSAFNIPDILWTVDDYWLSGLLAAKGIGIWLPAGLERPGWTDANELDALLDATIDGAGRSEANTRCVQYMQDNLGVWRQQAAEVVSS